MSVKEQHHYNFGEVQPIQYMQDRMTPEAFEGYLTGNVIKYMSRYRFKGGIEDVKKAIVYAEWLVDALAGGKVKV